MHPYHIYFIHNHALIIEFSKEISEEANNKVIALKDALESNPFEGFIECVPAYGSLAVYFSDDCSLTSVKSHIDNLLASSTYIGTTDNPQLIPHNQQPITIPVCYDPTLGFDVESVSLQLGIPIEEIISLHTSVVYRVYMIGFIPGFPYLGTLPKALEVPRKHTPRLSIPPGSVAIAGKQTGIYPAQVPGGWQVIGRTPSKMFDKTKDPCSFLRAGDRVQFKSITLEEFNQLS